MENEAKLFVATAVARAQSVGTIARCSCAFGVTEVIAVGSPTFSTYGAHGAQKYMQIRHFYYWHEFVTYIKEQHSARIIGLLPKDDDQIPQRKDLYSLKFNGPTCFIVCGKEGLPAEVLPICDDIIYVNVPVKDKELSVHMDAKLSICLHYFCSTMNRQPTSFAGGKHEVEQTPGEVIPRGQRIIIAKNNAVELPEEEIACDEIAGLFDET